MIITGDIITKMKLLIDSAQHLEDIGEWYYSELPAALAEIEELRQIGIVDMKQASRPKPGVLGIPEEVAVEEEVVVEAPVVVEEALVVEEPVVVEETVAVEEPVVVEAVKPARNKKNKE
jgi:hypothetical protein